MSRLLRTASADAVPENHSAQERALEASHVHQQLLDLVVDSADMILFVIDPSGTITHAVGSPPGYPEVFPGAVVGRLIDSVVETLPGAKEAVDEAFAGKTAEWKGPAGDCWLVVRLTPLYNEAGMLSGVAGIGMNCTELHDAEEALRQSEEKYRSLFENAVEGLYITTPEGRIVDANSACARCLGYASSSEVLMSPANDIAARYLRPQDRQRLLARLEEHGRVSNFEVMFTRRDGQPFWVSLNARGVFGENGELLQIEGFLTDIDDRKEGEFGLQRTLDATVAALGSVVELRDPYTAGHQRRVTELALAIAEQLGWNEERSEWLRLGALLHDIGKVMCPAEILSKPTRLSAAEMEVVKMHASAGAAILSGIAFDGPVVEAVAQHHERLDGSGYPAGLSSEMIPEARIIAVADVVEAMASHRPYRPALGVEVALDEIRAGRGRLYDADVADACVRAFAEGFDFEAVAQKV